MMDNIKYKVKKGAASFYIVAFSTLILVIIAISFVAIMISEMTRTSNDDLSQSAYDSALAGVEDATLAFHNYQKCLGKDPTKPNGDGKITCGEIVYWVQEGECDMVAHILGRIGELESGEVEIRESSTVSNNMSQSYTCAKLETVLSDYRSTLSSSQTSKIVRVKRSDGGVSDIKKIKISWYSDITNSTFRYSNYSSLNGGKVLFSPVSTKPFAMPPTISLTLIQTAKTFSFEDFDKTIGSTTDRGTLFLVPSGDEDAAKKKAGYNYIGAYNSDSGANMIGAAEGFLKSNDKVKDNRPFMVYCPEYSGNEFACSTTIDLPEPVGGVRSDETFAFVVSLPYGRPSTDFALEFYCADGKECAPKSVSGSDDTGDKSQVYLEGTQVKIDSTGRANDLFRRVESRLEPEVSDAESTLIQYAITLTGDGDVLKKQLSVTREWGE